jgi:hypothetical protein
MCLLAVASWLVRMNKRSFVSKLHAGLVLALHLQSHNNTAVVVLQTAVNAHPVPHRQFTFKMLIHDLKHISQLFYQQILGERVQHMCMR